MGQVNTKLFAGLIAWFVVDCVKVNDLCYCIGGKSLYCLLLFAWLHYMYYSSVLPLSGYYPVLFRLILPLGLIELCTVLTVCLD